MIKRWRRACPHGNERHPEARAGLYAGLPQRVAFSRASPRCAEDRQTVSPMITPAASHPFDHGGLKRPRTDNRRGVCPGSEREEARLLGVAAGPARGAKAAGTAWARDDVATISASGLRAAASLLARARVASETASALVTTMR